MHKLSKSILFIFLSFAVSGGWAGEYRAIDIDLAEMARAGNVKEVKKLLTDGANPNAILYGLTTIYGSAANGKSEVICPLIEGGADPNFIEKESGFTALRIATDLRYAEVAEKLIECGADVNLVYRHGMIVLSSMLMNILVFDLEEFRSTVKLALEKGADPNLGTLDSAIPLLLTIRFSDRELTCLLLDHGADINVVESETKDRLIQKAIEQWGADSKVVEKLLASADTEKVAN